MNKVLKEQLITEAVKASKYAFHPITKIGVGAAVLATDGTIYRGCNVQTTISGLGVCAEQCAIYSAVAHGKYDFEAVAVYFPSKRFIKPCGVCLQLIHEFREIVNKDIKIILIKQNGKTRMTSIDKELKGGYGPRTAGKDIKPYLHNHKE